MIDLRLGDCLTVLKTLPDNSIDLTVTSPPYDNLRTYNGSLNWNAEIWQAVIQQLFRATKQGGVVVWVVADATINGSETGTSFKQALYFMQCGFNLHDTMIYYRESIPKTHNRYEQHLEYMFVFSKGKPKTFNGLKKHNKTCGTNHSEPHENLIKIRDKNSLGTAAKKFKVSEHGLRGNVLKYNTGFFQSTKDKIAFQHPAIFPEQLASDHILSWSNENDLILDCFMGSGTTAKMAIIHKRSFIGIEINKDYFEIAQQRLKESTQQGSLL